MVDDVTRRVMNGYLEALLGHEDFAAFFAPEVTWTYMESGDQVRGREAVRDLITGMHEGSFDAHPELRKLVIGDGAALAEAVFIGTHTGEFAGIPATGLQVHLAYCMVYDVADGAITALRAYFPQGALAAQLTRAAAATAAVPAQERRSPRPAETGAQRR